MTKVLYVFAGADRGELEVKVRDGLWPDNWFFGYKQTKEHPDIKAEYAQIPKGKSQGNLHFFFSIYKQLREADVIVITSSAHFELLWAKKWRLLRRQKWILLNLDLTSKLKKSNKLLSLIKEADKIISVSQAQVDYLVSIGLKREILEFIHFGIDKSFYHQLAPQHKGIIFAVGRDAGRDYGTLMRAMEDVDHKAVIMCRPRNLEHLPERRPANVEIAGEMTPLDTREYYERAIASVVPAYGSEHTDGSDCSGQTVILESMGYGRPVIATRKELFKDYFIEGKHLLVVPPGDAEALSAAITRLCSDAELAEELVKQGEELVETQYNSDTMGRQIAEVILSV